MNNSVLSCDEISGAEIFWQSPPTSFCLMAAPNRILLKINIDGTVEGDLEDMGEAAALFVHHVREIMSKLA